MNAARGSTSHAIKAAETIGAQTAAMHLAARTLALVAVAACASGCATAAVGAAASVGVYALQDRTIGEGIDDAVASQQTKMRLLAADASAFREVDVEVANRSLLLSGAAPTEEHRQMAETIARSVGSIDHVYNEIFVGESSSLVRSAQDEFITAQIRARLAASPAVRAININIETFHGNVYLLGAARSEHELRRAAEIASVVGGVRRVVSFMRVRPVAGADVAAAEPEALPDAPAEPGLAGPF
jgi:osmotically-inducible protein OsmY